MIGLFLTVGVASEIAVMFLSGRMLRHIGYKMLFLLGVLGSALGWYVCCIAAAPTAMRFGQNRC